VRSARYWLPRPAPPPLYPNLVTLDPEPGPALQAVRELARAGPRPPWAVKDSFAVLPLAGEGFRPLLDAEWIVRPVGGAAAPRPPSRRWIRVESEQELAAFEAAWGESAGKARVFLPALLRRPEIAFLAALDGEGLVAAGVVANRSERAVGVSNFFAPAGRGELRAEAVAAAADAFPGLPLVGYESGHALAEWRGLGFLALGRLRVWLREA
jgi:hypothetical protein